MSFRLRLIALGLALPTLAAAQHPSSAALAAMTPERIARIQQERAAKDSTLRHDPNSPIPPPQRAAFGGLDYFPINPDLRLVGELHIYARRRRIQVPTSAHSLLGMERFGRLFFRVGGKPFWLEIYRSLQGEEDLLVLFKDQTNGRETYHGGRFAPLTPVGDGRYILDFNLAYNPYCAYNPEWVCPLPPPQNTLPIALRAGEKTYGPELAGKAP